MQVPKLNSKSLKETLIGLEFENQLIYSQTGLAVKKRDIIKLWKELSKRQEYDPIYDQYSKVIIGVTKKVKDDIIVINTDTGVCLLEIAMPPQNNLLKAEKEWRKEFKFIIEIAKKFGFTALSLSATPRTIVRDTYSIKTDKGLYQLMNDRYPRHNVMIPIASHQVCIDVKLKDVIKAVNSFIKLGGLFIALTANSVIENDKIQLWKEIRTLHWNVPMSSGIKDWEKIFGGYPIVPYKNLSDYFKNIWQATPLVIVKDKEWATIDNKKVSVWKYLSDHNEYRGTSAEGKKVRLKADKDDLNLMMMLAWNDVKPHVIVDSTKVNLDTFMQAIKHDNLDNYLIDKVISCYIEIRMCPVGAKKEEMAFPALALGLINNLSKTIRFSNQFTWEEGRKLKNILSIKAMDYSFKNIPITDYLKKLVDIANEGLKKRGNGEEKYLKILYNRIQKKEVPADKTIKVFNNEGMEGVIKHFSY